jgi:hypothetical protein
VRGYSGLANLPLLPIGIGLGAFALYMLFSNRSAIVSTGSRLVSNAVDFAKVAVFKAAVPTVIGPYAGLILAAAQKYSVDPFALAAIMYRESRGGTAAPHYRPLGPGGTGDFTPRKGTGVGHQYANPATGLPPDGGGWGRGLMQIDYGVHIDWMKAGGKWWDAETNINKGAEVLAEKYRYFKNGPGPDITVESWRVTRGKPEYGIQPWQVKFPRSGPWPTKVRDVRPLSGQQLLEASIAAYNVSYTGVLQALGLGLPAEAGTSGQDYVTSFLKLVAGWRAAYDKMVG